MEKRLYFATKAETNRRREREFLALSGEERFAEFLSLSRRVLRDYPSAQPRDYGDNLVLERPRRPGGAVRENMPSDRR